MQHLVQTKKTIAKKDRSEWDGWVEIKYHETRFPETLQIVEYGLWINFRLI